MDLNFDALFTKNSLLVYTLLILLGILIQYLKRFPNIILLLASLLTAITIILRDDDIKYKQKLLIVMLCFGLYGIISESLIIQNTGILTYSYPNSSLNLNFPLWLFFIYTSWSLLLEIIFKFTRIIK